MRSLARVLRRPFATLPRVPTCLATDLMLQRPGSPSQARSISGSTVIGPRPVAGGSGRLRLSSRCVSNTTRAAPDAIFDPSAWRAGPGADAARRVGEPRGGCVGAVGRRIVSSGISILPYGVQPWRTFAWRIVVRQRRYQPAWHAFCSQEGSFRLLGRAPRQRRKTMGNPSYPAGLRSCRQR
jgi:hypothetical protein